MSVTGLACATIVRGTSHLYKLDQLIDKSFAALIVYAIHFVRRTKINKFELK